MAHVNNGPLTINDIAPLEFADEVEEGEVVDEGEEGGVVDVPTVGVPDNVAEEDNVVPTALAAAWKAAKELLVPSTPGLTANTIPLPQWLAGVFSPCLQ